MMTRRDTLKTVAVSAGAALFARAYGATAASKSKNIKVPENRKIHVAFTLGQESQVIDVAGPWKVFQDVYINDEHAFELYTVGANKGIVTMTGGMLVTPNYTVDNAPRPDIIVSPAHRSVPEITEWLKVTSPHATVTTSVCTGAYNLAEAGILDGLTATTFHRAFDDFESRFPKVTLSRGRRFIDQGHVVTSGGLTSGIDMSLHIVQRYFDIEAAHRTANFMEYESDGWKQSKAAKAF